MTFRAGDIVRLKSGGPAMTVTEISEELKRVYCDWFDGSVRVWANFPVTTVEASTPDPVKPDEASEPLTMRERELRPATAEEAMSRRHAAVADGPRTKHCYLCGAPLDSWIHGPVKAP